MCLVFILQYKTSLSIRQGMGIAINVGPKQGYIFYISIPPPFAAKAGGGVQKDDMQ